MASTVGFHPSSDGSNPSSHTTFTKIKKEQTKMNYSNSPALVAVARNVQRAGVIIGSVADSGLVSFSANPVIHVDAEAARSEAKRLANQNPGKMFIMAKLVGAEFVPTNRISI